MLVSIGRGTKSHVLLLIKALYSLSPPTFLIPPAPPVGIPPPPAPAPASQHPMVTRSQNGITKPHIPLCLHPDIISPLPTSHLQAAKDPYWNNAMGGGGKTKIGGDDGLGAGK